MSRAGNAAAAAYGLLTAAGAPELPTDHFYRIKQDPHSDHVVRVEVRKVAERIGSKALGSATFSTRSGEPALTATVAACHTATAEAFPNGVPA